MTLWSDMANEYLIVDQLKRNTEAIPLTGSTKEYIMIAILAVSQPQYQTPSDFENEKLTPPCSSQAVY